MHEGSFHKNPSENIIFADGETEVRRSYHDWDPGNEVP